MESQQPGWVTLMQNSPKLEKKCGFESKLTYLIICEFIVSKFTLLFLLLEIIALITN